MSQQSAISQMQELQIEKEKVNCVNWFKKSLDFSFYVALNSSPIDELGNWNESAKIRSQKH